MFDVTQFRHQVQFALEKMPAQRQAGIACVYLGQLSQRAEAFMKARFGRGQISDLTQVVLGIWEWCVGGTDGFPKDKIDHYRAALSAFHWNSDQIQNEDDLSEYAGIQLLGSVANLLDYLESARTSKIVDIIESCLNYADYQLAQNEQQSLTSSAIETRLLDFQKKLLTQIDMFQNALTLRGIKLEATAELF